MRHGSLPLPGDVLEDTSANQQCGGEGCYDSPAVERQEPIILFACRFRVRAHGGAPSNQLIFVSEIDVGEIEVDEVDLCEFEISDRADCEPDSSEARAGQYASAISST